MRNLIFLAALVCGSALAGSGTENGITAFFVRYPGQVAAVSGFQLPKGCDLLFISVSSPRMAGHFEVTPRFHDVRPEASPDGTVVKIRHLVRNVWGATAYIAVPEKVAVDSIVVTYLQPEESGAFVDNGTDSPVLSMNSGDHP